MGGALLILEGFIAKIITGLDDTLTHTPIIASITKKRLGKIVFLIGMFFSILTLILIAILFADFLAIFPYKNLIAAGLLFLIALYIYLDRFVYRKKERYLKRKEKEAKGKIRIIELFTLGYITFFATGIDDAVVYSSLLLKSLSHQLIIASGIILAALFEFIIIFNFSKLVNKIKYKEIITIIGLVILAILVGFQII